jgi:hypothetical protein
MDVQLARALAEVRRAVALAHALPRCVIVLETVEGGTVEVGFRRDPCVQGTPCDLREALCLVLAGLAGDGGLRLGGRTLGHVGARLVVGDDAGLHVGLGLYRYRSCSAQGFVLASLAPVMAVERRLREVVADLQARAGLDGEEAIEHAEVRLVHDPAIDVSLVFLEYPLLPLLEEGGAEERVAIALAAGCLAEELAAELESPTCGGDLRGGRTRMVRRRRW